MRKLKFLILLCLPALLFSVVYDTSTMTQDQGFTFNGANRFGLTVSFANFNGDDYADAFMCSSAAQSCYLVFGDASSDLLTSYGSFSFTPSTDMSENTGFKITRTGGSFFKLGISNSADINNDGFDDIIIIEDTSIYILFGASSEDLKTRYGGSTLTLSSTMSEEVGFEIKGTGYGFGTYTTLTDINKDGYADIIIGVVTLKIVYVIFGDTKSNLKSKFGGVTTFNPISGLTDSIGFKIQADPSDRVSFSNFVGRAGDFNKDGYGDFLIADTGASSSYLLFGNEKSNLISTYGSASTFKVSGTMSKDIGFRFKSSTSGFGSASTYAGDINNDGFSDIILANKNEPAVYIMFGDTSVNLYSKYGDKTEFIVSSTMSNDIGFQLKGATGTELGSSADAAGDLNLDGYDDMLIYAGKGNIAYVLFGDTKANLASKYEGSSFTLSDTMDTSIGFKIVNTGTSNNGAMSAISGGGDFNNDGFVDILLSNGYNNQAYIITNHCPPNVNFKGLCYNECPVGSTSTLIAPTHCKACTSPCSACSETITNCTACVESSPLLYKNQCYSTCPSGTYADSSSTCALIQVSTSSNKSLKIGLGVGLSLGLLLIFGIAFFIIWKKCGIPKFSSKKKSNKSKVGPQHVQIISSPTSMSTEHGKVENEKVEN